MNGSEFLKTSHLTEALHGALPSSEWQVCILNTVVELAPTFLQTIISEVPQRGPVGREAIRNQHLWSTVALHQFSQRLQCGPVVSALRDNALQHLTLVIYGPPAIVALAFYLQEDFVHVPLPYLGSTQLLNPLSSDL